MLYDSVHRWWSYDKIMIRFLRRRQSPLLPAKLSLTFKWCVKWGQTTAEREAWTSGSICKNIPQLMTRWWLIKWILDPGVNTEQVGLDGKSYLYLLGHSVLFFYTFKGAIFCQYFKWHDSFMLRTWSPWSDLEYCTSLVNHWLTDGCFLLLFYYIILYNANRNLGLLKSQME